MNKEFLKMQKLAGLITESQLQDKLKENEDNIPSHIDEFLEGMINMSIPEEAEEGEKVTGVWESDEYADEEAYGDSAADFIEAYKYIKSKGGSIIVSGDPDVTYTALPNGSIKYDLIVS